MNILKHMRGATPQIKKALYITKTQKWTATSSGAPFWKLVVTGKILSVDSDAEFFRSQGQGTPTATGQLINLRYGRSSFIAHEWGGYNETITSGISYPKEWITYEFSMTTNGYMNYLYSGYYKQNGVVMKSCPINYGLEYLSPYGVSALSGVEMLISSIQVWDGSYNLYYEKDFEAGGTIDSKWTGGEIIDVIK